MDRLAARVAHGGVLTIDEAFRQIAHHIHFLVHLQLRDDSWRGGRRTRFVSEVRALTGAVEGNRPVTHLVYRAAGPGGGPVYSPEASTLEELEPFLGDWRSR